MIRESNRSDFAQSGRIQTRSQIYIGIQHSIRKLVVHSARALLCVLSPQNALVEEALAGWEEAERAATQWRGRGRAGLKAWGVLGGVAGREDGGACEREC